MQRRELLKNIFGLSLFSLLAKIEIATPTKTTNYFIGLGGAGCNIVESQISKNHIGKFIFINNNTRNNIPNNVRLIKSAVLDEYTDECAKKHIIITNEMKKLFTDQDGFYHLFVGLGGMTGSELCKKLIPYLVNEKINFKLIYTLPNNFEGRQRKIKAVFASNFISELSNCKHFCFDRFRKEYGHLPVAQFWEEANVRMFELSLQII